MVTILFVIGIVTIIGGIIIAIATATLSGFIGFISVLLSTAVSSIIYFALSRTLENQEKIMHKLDQMNTKSSKVLEKVTCTRCGNTYTSDYSSCPKCGNRDYRI